MLSESTAERSRGGFSGAVRDACAFQIVSLSYGSSVAELELPTTAQAPLPEMNLGLRATDTFIQLSRLLTTEQAWEQVAELLPTDGYRRQILRTYQDVCPTEDEQLVVSVGDVLACEPAFRLTHRERALARVYAVKTAVDDIVERRSFIGRLTTLDSDPCFTFGLKQGSRQFDFPGDLQRHEALIDLWKRDAWVRVDAVARIIKHDDRDDQILELLDVDEVVEVDMSALIVNEFVSAGRVIALIEPLVVRPQAEGGLVVYDHPELRIVASGATPQEATEEFLEELGWLWEAYAEARDDELTADALKLKTLLHQLVEGGNVSRGLTQRTTD